MSQKGIEITPSVTVHAMNEGDDVIKSYFLKNTD